MDSNEFSTTNVNTKGKKCIYYGGGKKCPGLNIHNKEGKIGCPDWQYATVVFNNGNEIEERGMWGCYRIMDQEFTKNLTKRTHGAAAAVENSRNRIEEFTKEVNDKITHGFSSMTQVLLEGQNVRAEQLELNLINELSQKIPIRISGNGDQKLIEG